MLESWLLNAGRMLSFGATDESIVKTPIVSPASPSPTHCFSFPTGDVMENPADLQQYGKKLPYLYCVPIFIEVYCSVELQ